MDKKNLIQSIAAGAAASVLLSGCTSPFSPKENEPVAIYGPPEHFEQQAVDDGPDDKDTTMKNDEYDPSMNEPIDIYGPPVEDADE